MNHGVRRNILPGIMQMEIIGIFHVCKKKLFRQQTDIYKVAYGPSGDDYNWTRVIMDNIAKNTLISIGWHFITLLYNTKLGEKVQLRFDKNEYYEDNKQNGIYG